jgi:flavin-dependent dehydrogenase
MTYDAVIVGARCAGAATAMLLARAGARVLLVDRGRYGADTLSTHALMRGAVLQLHRWGLLPSLVAAGTPPVRSTTFSYATHDVTVPIAPKHGVSALFAPRRSLLDRILVDAAADAGAEVTYGVRVDGLAMDTGGRVRGVKALAGSRRRRFAADIVIGADGLYSTIAQRAGAAAVVTGQHATATLYGYWEGLEAEGFNWRFQPGISLGAIPTNAHATCVSVSVPSSRLPREVHRDATSAYRRLILEASPLVAARLDEARLVEPVRGFGGHRGFIKTGAGPGWALVGDAGYFKDPLTAHGITDALRDAELLTRAAMRGTTAAWAEYDITRHDLSRKLFEVTDDIASFAWTDEEVQGLHRAFSAEMSREVRALAALAPLPYLSAPVSASQAG